MIDKEILRIQAEYARRETEIDDDRYAPWQPAEMLHLSERRNKAAAGLRSIGKFPVAGQQCLEIGYGRLGWLADLISWGLRETDLHGIELDESRAKAAQLALPNADLRIGNAARLPWDDRSFSIVIISTVFSSILGPDLRRSIASEIDRVVKPGGVVICYDLRRNNPQNRSVRAVTRSELKELFPNFNSHLKTVTLVPPLARAVAPISEFAARCLALIPLLRTHLLSFLIKRESSE